MIVKNEAETLEQCLVLARPYIDEMVIVDTGSTDGTQEIARRYADVFEEIEWPDSFAIARNYSFDLATGDYILVLDGDEYLPDPVQWRRLRKMLRSSEVAGIQLMIRNLLPEGQIVGADRIWQERVFLNHPRIRYQGRVHNQIQDGLLAYMQETGRKLIRLEAEIVHTGYALSEAKMKAKYQTRIHLLRAEVEEATSARVRAYYAYQLAVVYFVMQDYEAAMAVFNRLEFAELSPQNAFYTHLLAAQTALKLKMAPMALVHCNQMLSIERFEPVAYYTTGLALLQAGKIGDGMLMLLEAYNVNHDGGISVRFILNPQYLVEVLASLCGRLQLNVQAAAFKKLNEEGNYDPELIKKMIASLKLNIVRAEMKSAAA